MNQREQKGLFSVKFELFHTFRFSFSLQRTKKLTHSQDKQIYEVFDMLSYVLVYRRTFDGQPRVVYPDIHQFSNILYVGLADDNYANGYT